MTLNNKVDKIIMNKGKEIEPISSDEMKNKVNNLISEFMYQFARNDFDLNKSDLFSLLLSSAAGIGAHAIENTAYNLKLNQFKMFTHFVNTIDKRLEELDREQIMKENNL